MTVTVAVPAYNESIVINPTIDRLLRIMRQWPNLSSRLVVCDNGSTDNTGAVLRPWLERGMIEVITVSQAGKGAAISAVWDAYPADWLMFIDADCPFVDADLIRLPIGFDQGDVLVGWRHGARSRRRRLYSITYNGLAWAVFGLSVPDLACGLKAIRGPLWQRLRQDVTDRQWFFDSELVIRADTGGAKVHNMTVGWRDELDHVRPSRLSPWRVAMSYIIAVFKLKIRLLQGH